MLYMHAASASLLCPEFHLPVHFLISHPLFPRKGQVPLRWFSSFAVLKRERVASMWFLKCVYKMQFQKAKWDETDADELKVPKVQSPAQMGFWYATLEPSFLFEWEMPREFYKEFQSPRFRWVRFLEFYRHVSNASWASPKPSAALHAPMAPQSKEF